MQCCTPVEAISLHQKEPRSKNPLLLTLRDKLAVRAREREQSRERTFFLTRQPPHTTPAHSIGSMAFSQPILRTLCSVLFFLSCVQALKFDIEAFSKGDSRGTRCIRNFVAKDTLVVVTATVDGTKGDGMILNMHVSCCGNCFKGDEWC